MSTPSLSTRLPAGGPLSPRSLAWPLALGVPAGVLLWISLRQAYGPRDFYDFHIFWHAGRAVLHGRNPYPPATVAALRHQDQFVYPAFSALAMAPLALLPLSLAATLFIAANLLAVPLALRAVGVRDWRCHAITLCSIATLQGVVMGQLSCLILLAAALAWRWRERRLAALPVALAIAAKLFLIPLVVWLWATGRRTTAALTCAAAAALMLIGWAAIGFKDLTGYPHLLSMVSSLEERFGYSPVALGSALGLPVGTARATALAATALLCAAAAGVARRSDGDRRAFTLAAVASLTLSPIVWLSYFVLLAAPVALYRRTLSPAWLIMLAPWAFANPNTFAPTWKIVLWTLALAAVAALAVNPHRRPEPAGDQAV
jgi:alpha-1,2-mannosyltransferase